MRIYRKERPSNIAAIEEYKKIGVELKNTTREKIAEKFGISYHGLSCINRMDFDDFRLIKELLEDRKKSLTRRAHLRRTIAP